MKTKCVFNALVALSLSFTAMVTGCSSSEKQSTTGSEQQVKTNGNGGTLVVVRSADANNLDPHFLTTIVSGSIVNNKIYEGLVRLSKDMTYQPALATEWKQLSDVIWEFKLRQGVTFHDGSPFNADAVVKTFERILDKNVGATRAQAFEMVKEVKPIDDFTIQFILKRPFAPFFTVLAGSEGSILSPKAVEQYGKELTKHPTGTGPFTFQSWLPGQEIVLVRNETYWGEQAKVDKVVFKVIPEDATRIAMVESGEAHVAEQLPVSEINRVQSSKVMGLGSYDSFGVDYIGFNFRKKPFDDVRVRQAISHAIDSGAIIQGIFNGIGTPANTSLAPTVFGYDPQVKLYSYDLNKARLLLKEAGYPDGFQASIYTSDNKLRISMAEVIQSQLKGIGIDLQVQVMEIGAYVAAASKGETEMFISNWGASADGDYTQYNLFHSRSQGSPGNHFFYSNPQVDQLIDGARSEVASEKRKQLYAKAQQLEMEDAVMIPIRNSVNLAAISSHAKGIWISPNGHIQVNEAVITP
ncbi:glutathione ABC transporter substrate-binding protein [Brevibacillus sp. NRS-1366]|uniref:glutathione ABC transporter substrate-binding protein n=1 Tax=Brevibacillus sp. NRS-1366 TaxID=3233899 RepID=UPI003D19F1C8